MQTWGMHVKPINSNQVLLELGTLELWGGNIIMLRHWHCGMVALFSLEQHCFYLNGIVFT